MPNSEEKIVELLAENNQLLNKLYQLQLAEVKTRKRKEWIHLILQLVPFLILAVLIWFVYSTLMHYIDTLNNNIDLLKTSVINFFDGFKKFIPDFSGAEQRLQDLWQNLKSGI